MIWWSLALFVALRLVVIAAADTPSITPDELGAWAIAQWLVGAEARISMQDLPRYPLGPGLAVAPIQALGLSPVIAYQLAMVLLSGVVVLAAALARRAMRVVRPGDPLLQAAAFALTLLFPATLATSSFTWAEPVVLLWWTAVLWGLAVSILRAAPNAILLTSAVIGLAPAVHGRVILAPATWCAALGVLGISSALRSSRPVPLRGSTAAIGILITVVVTFAALAADQAAADAIWTAGSLTGGRTIRPLDADWWSGSLFGGITRTWYALVASAGLVAVGTAGLVTAAARGKQPRERTAATILGALVSGNVLIAVVVSSEGMASPGRIGAFGQQRLDHVVYGRYIDVAVLVLCLVALLVARECTRRSRVQTALWAGAAMTFGTGLFIIARLQGTELAPRIDVMIAGISWVPAPAGIPAIAVWTAAGVAVTAACAVAMRRGWDRFVTLFGAWVVLGSLLVTFATAGRHLDVAQPDLAGPLDAPQGAVELLLPADSARDPLWRLGVMAQQRDLSHLGWRVVFTPENSATVAAAMSHGHPEVGAMALTSGVEPTTDAWHRVSRFGEVEVWRRVEEP